MDNQKEMVLVEKEQLEKLFDMLESMQEKIESLDNEVYRNNELLIGIGEHLKIY